MNITERMMANEAARTRIHEAIKTEREVRKRLNANVKKRHRWMNAKIVNHLKQCKACKDGEPCDKAKHYGLILQGGGWNFEKLSKMLGEARVEQLHGQIHPEKKKLDALAINL